MLIYITRVDIYHLHIVWKTSPILLTLRFLDVHLHTEITKYCGVEQLVARWAHNPKVVSSSLTPATKEAWIKDLGFYIGALMKVSLLR